MGERREKEVKCERLGTLPGKGSGPGVELVSQKARWANVDEKPQTFGSVTSQPVCFCPVTVPGYKQPAY